MSNVKRSSNGSQCPECGTPMAVGANFCQQCGAPASGRATERRPQNEKKRNSKLISLFMLGTAVWCFALLYVAMKFMSGGSVDEKDPHAGVTMPSAQSASSVDLSSMTPREAADRLFNRVMAADEQGRTEEVMQFGPMALEAYKLVGLLDADARYHIGLISLLLGDIDNTREQIRNLEAEAPDHLLGLALAYNVAEKMGDDKALSKVRSRFMSAYDSEIKSGRPEYDAHKVTIDSFHAETMGETATGTSR